MEGKILSAIIAKFIYARCERNLLCQKLCQKSGDNRICRLRLGFIAVVAILGRFIYEETAENASDECESSLTLGAD